MSQAEGPLPEARRSEGNGHADGRPGKYSHLSRDELVALLERRDRGRARIGLNWSPDNAERDQALNDAFVTLRLDRTLSDGAAPWPNLLIEGDNFDVLRWLRMTLRGRVKCIYVDPPYNTGAGDWAYNDHYHAPGDFFQTTWLEFLHRRFLIARDLLSEDGVLFVSINDSNRALLELMLDQTLPGMKLGSLVWRTRDTTSANEQNFSPVHEHVLVYAGPEFSFSGAAKSKKKYKNPDNDPNGPWNIDPLTLAFDRFDRENLFYPLRNPVTDIWYPCDEDRVWAYASREFSPEGRTVRTKFMEDWIAARMIVFPESDDRVVVWGTKEDLLNAIDKGDVPTTPQKKLALLTRQTPNLDFWVGKKVGFGRPGFKKYWKNLQSHIAPLSSWISRRNEPEFEEIHTFATDGSGAGTNDLQAVFGRKAFNYPKPVSLIRELIRQAAGPNDLVVDFFAGSGTTGQAVIELNSEDRGGRRFVLVSHDEATIEQPDRNLAREVMRERIRLLNESADNGMVAASPFAYLRSHQVPVDTLMDSEALTPEDIWLAVQAMNELPLMPYDPAEPIQVHEGNLTAISFCDQVTSESIDVLKAIAKRRKGLIVYTWTPGPLYRALDGYDIDVHRLPQALHDRFIS
jgi:adenine-specific DNA-methyltransferase